MKQTQSVAISVFEGLDRELLDLLSRNELDVVVSAPGLGANYSEFVTVPLISSRTALVVRNHHPLLAKESVSLADLEDSLWALPPEGGAFWTQTEGLFTAYGFPFPQRCIQASSIHILTRIIQLSDAVTLASEEVVSDELAVGNLRSIELSEQMVPRLFGIHTRANSELGSLGKLFSELAKDYSSGGDVQQSCTSKS